MYNTILSVQHGGTHFTRKLFSLLGVEAAHFHADAQSLTNAVDRLSWKDKVIFVVRHPYLVAGTTYRRSVVAGHGANPYWLTVQVSDWFHNMQFLQNRVASKNGHLFKVDQDVEAGTHIGAYHRLLQFLDVPSTPAADQFVADWALEGWSDARDLKQWQIDKATLVKLNWACRLFGYDIPDDHKAAQICFRPKGTERKVEKLKTQETHDARS